MCGGGMSYPNPIGERISQLKPGDQVIILKGEGSPAAWEETCTIIWKVSGYSALTADGIAISCQNLSDLIITGNHFEPYPVSPEAMQIWDEILAAQKDAQDSDTKPDWSIPPAFGIEPE